MEDYHEQLDQLQRQIEADYNEKVAGLDSQRARLEASHKTALDTLSQLRKALSTNGSQLVGAASGFRAKTLTQAVNHVINNFIVDEFDINTVIAAVIRHHPEIKQPINPTSVSGILRALKGTDILDIIHEGAGPKPTIYRLNDYGREQFKLVEEVRQIRQIDF